MTKLSIKPHKPIILASTSKIRAQLLKKTGLNFVIKNSFIDEESVRKSITNKNITKLAKVLACAKAKKISDAYPNAYTIGADQICSLNKTILDKPLNKTNANKQLKILSGKTHKQTSAICIYHKGKILWNHVEEAYMTMHKLNNEEIEAYILLDKPYQSCGSYKFESYGQHLFSKVVGDSFTIQGFPIISLLKQLRKYKLYSLIKN